LVDNVKHVALRADDARGRARYAGGIANLPKCRTQIMSTSAKDNASRVEPQGEPRPDGATESSPPTKGASPQAGRIVHDSRGNAVWNWAQGGDASSTASTSKMLRKLDLGNLRMEDDAPAAEKQPDAKKGGSGYGPGYNPYDRTAPVRSAALPKKGSSK
jgi:hypothetical protein